jgi:hypothetical protein
MRSDADIHYDAQFPAINPAPNIYEAQAWLRDYFLNTTEAVTMLSIGGGTNFGTLFQSAQNDEVLQQRI